MNKIVQLIEDIEEFFEQCSGLPFSNKVVVDKEDLFEILTELRLKIPDEIKKAERLIEEKEKIIKDAKSAAINMEKEAEGKIVDLVNDHEIIQQAYEKGNQIIKSAKKDSNEMRLSAISYVDEKLEELEKATQHALNALASNFELVTEELACNLETIRENRQELQLSANSNKDISNQDEEE